LVAHRQLAFSSLDLLDLKAAFGQAHVERRSRAILAAVLERIPEIGKAGIMIAIAPTIWVFDVTYMLYGSGP
jgi:hypothetical protein